MEQIIPLLNNYHKLSLIELDQLRILANKLSSSLGCYLYDKNLIEKRSDKQSV